MKFKLFIFAAFTMAAGFCGTLNASAQNEDTDPDGTLLPIAATQDEKAQKIARIIENYNDWQTVGLSGKLKMPGLPVTPTVKIFMVRDSLVRISLRAPFVGEVGRAEINDSTATIVNKMNKTYLSQPVDSLLRQYPGGIADIQDLLLARIVIPGAGLIRAENQAMVEIYPEADGTASLVAADPNMIEGVSFGYALSAEDLLAAIMILPDNKPDVNVSLQYQYFEKGYDIQFAYRSDTKNYYAELQLDNPDWDAQGFEPFKMNGKYSEVSLDQLLKM